MVWAMKGGGLCGAEGQVAGFGQRNDSGECIPESPCVTVLGSSRPSQLGVGDGRVISGSPLGEG